MNNLKTFLLRYPTRSKYILLIVDIFLVIVASKMFINYNNIKLAIDETAFQGENKKQEVAFSENFQLPYEKSDYAGFFLKHENNILLQKEFIIKLQAKKHVSTTGNIQDTGNKTRFIENPEESRKQFFYEQLFIKK